MAATIEVDFVGGPFDGHRQMLSLAEESLAETVAFPVNRNVFRLLAGLPNAPSSPTTSVAIYELEIVDDRLRYYFLGATSPTQPFAESEEEGAAPSPIDSARRRRDAS